MEPKIWIGWNIFDGSRLGRLDIVRALIEEHGEDPNIMDSAGYRPLDIAIAGGHRDVRAYLESVGGEPYRAVPVDTSSDILPGGNAVGNGERGRSATKLARNLLTFDGRIGRMEFIGSVIAGWVAALALAFIAGLVIGLMDPYDETSDAVWFVLLYPSLVLGMWVQFASGAKRLHDLDHTGWLQAIPIVNIIIYLMLISKSSIFAEFSENEEHTGFVWGSRRASDGEKLLAAFLIFIVAAIYTALSLVGESTASYY